MSINKLAVLIAQYEGKKSQAKIGDIKEILAILSDLSFKSPHAMCAILQNGIKRAKKKK